jgi:hypothetical protein
LKHFATAALILYKYVKIQWFQKLFVFHTLHVISFTATSHSENNPLSPYLHGINAIYILSKCCQEHGTVIVQPTKISQNLRLETEFATIF